MVLNPNQLQVTIYHIQANAIIERVHKVVNDILRSFDLENNHENLGEMMKIIHFITYFNQLHAYQDIRSTYHTTLQTTPCQIVFGRDMIHNIAFRENRDQVKKETGHYK
jgi:hypothetical protein